MAEGEDSEGGSVVVAAEVVVKEESRDSEGREDVKPNFLLSSDFYKNLLERAVFNKSCDAFPRNFLYSCVEDGSFHEDVSLRTH